MINIRKHLFLFAGLLALPIAAKAADMTLNVPVELTNVPAANTQINVACRVGVGAGPTTVPRAIWPSDSQIGGGSATVTIPTNRNYRGTVRIEVTASPGKSLNAATHYKCQLQTMAGQPALTGQNEVSGAIPR